MRRRSVKLSVSVAVALTLVIPTGASVATSSSEASDMVVIEPKGPRLSIAKPQSATPANKRAEVRGRAKGFGSTQVPVKLQCKKKQGKWVTVDKTTTTKNGRYTFKPKLVPQKSKGKWHFCHKDGNKRPGKSGAQAELPSTTHTAKHRSVASLSASRVKSKTISHTVMPSKNSCVINGTVVSTPANKDDGPIKDALARLVVGETNGTIKIQGNCGDYGIDVASGQELTLRGLPTGERPAVIDASPPDIEGSPQVACSNTSMGNSAIQNSGNLTLSGSLSITGAKATKGGGIHNTGGTVTINDGVSISGNSACNGSGVYNDKGTVNVDGGTISSNASAEITDDFNAVDTLNMSQGGGGIFNLGLGGSAIVNINGGKITNNKARTGAGIVSMGGEININDDATVSNNTAQVVGGGMYIIAFADITIDGAEIASNTAGWEGGGIYNENGSVTLNQGGSITKNTAGSGTIDGFGGGIYNSYDWIGQGMLTLNKGGSITKNTASSDGGGVYTGWYQEKAGLVGCKIDTSQKVTGCRSDVSNNKPNNVIAGKTPL